MDCAWHPQAPSQPQGKLRFFSCLSSWFCTPQNTTTKHKKNTAGSKKSTQSRAQEIAQNSTRNRTTNSKKTQSRAQEIAQPAPQKKNLEHKKYHEIATSPEKTQSRAQEIPQQKDNCNTAKYGKNWKTRCPIMGKGKGHNKKHNYEAQIRHCGFEQKTHSRAHKLHTHTYIHTFRRRSSPFSGSLSVVVYRHFPKYSYSYSDSIINLYLPIFMMVSG